MTNYTSLIRAQLTNHGYPADILSFLPRLLKGDEMVAMAMRLAMVGALAALLRSAFYRWHSRLADALNPTAYILSTDPAFGWIHTYLAQDPSVAFQIRSYRVTTSDERASHRDENRRHNTQLVKDGLALSKKDATWSNDEVVAQLLPIDGQSIRIQYMGHTVWVTKSDTGYAAQSGPTKTDHLRVQSWGFSSHIFRDFILASHKLLYTKDDGEILIFHPSPYNGNWYYPIARPTRSWDSIVLPADQKDEIPRDVECLSSEEEKTWYAARGIPHRRGYLLFGPPGSGKTTLATGIASRLKLDLYCNNPAARGMDVGKLNKAFRSCPPGNLILIEDIDCVMPSRQRGRKTDDDSDDEADDSSQVPEGDPGKFGLAKSADTLSGLLNAIDGVASQEDSVLFASTNYPDKLDEALRRPGRFDVHVPLQNATPAQAIELYKHFYPFEEYKIAPTSDVVAEKNAEGFVKQEEVEASAQGFASNVFDKQVEVSMAALQEFLLRYKKAPKKAVVDADDWSAGLKAEHDEKERRKEDGKAEREARKLAPSTPSSQ